MGRKKRRSRAERRQAAAAESLLQTAPAAVEQLLDALGEGDVCTVEQALSTLGLRRDSALYERVGRMVRQLHDALTEFKANMDPGNVTMSTTSLPDATDKLESVIEMTHNAASTTLSLAERQQALIEEQLRELAHYRKILTPELCATNPWGAHAARFLEKQEQRAKEVHTLTNEVLMAQTYQDLSGQALRKVIRLVTGLEANLVQLIQLFGAHEPRSKETTIIEGVEPQPKPAKDDDLEQDEVDSILNNFGF